MEKVICVKCGSVGYTAAPRFVRCAECGGRHKVVRMRLSHFKGDIKGRG